MISPLQALIRIHEMNVEEPDFRDSVEKGRLEQSFSSALARKYGLTFRKFGAAALVPMERGVCRGCYTRQPAMMEEIDEDVHECFNCGRLIYDPDVAYDFSVN